MPTPEQTARSIAPHAIQHSAPPLQLATNLLTPQERLRLAAMDGDPVAGMRLRDLLERVEGHAGVCGMAALLRSLAEEEPGKAHLGPAKRVCALHKLASLWPRWQRGKGVLDLVAALGPGSHQRIAWSDVHGQADRIAGAKDTFRCLDMAHLALLEILAAPLQEERLLPPSVPSLAHTAPEQNDALVRLLLRCPVPRRHTFAALLGQVRNGSRDDVALFDSIPEFTPAQWDTFMGAIEGMNAVFSTLPVQRQLRPLFAVAALGSAQAALFARFVRRTGMNQLDAWVQGAQACWLALRDLDDLTARANAAMEVAGWARRVDCRCAEALLERFFDPALQDPAEYLALLRRHRAEHADAKMLEAMLNAPRHLLPVVALVGDGDAALQRRVEAMLPRAQAVAPWLELCEGNAKCLGLVLDIAERVPMAHLTALAQSMRLAPRADTWLMAAHGCSAAALTRFAQRPQVSVGLRAWTQLAACALLDEPASSTVPTAADAAAVVGAVVGPRHPTTLEPFKALLRALPTEAHRQVWADDTRIHWDGWDVSSAESALQLARRLPADRYASALASLQRLSPWVAVGDGSFDEVLRLPEGEQLHTAQALVLFGTPATPERRRLAQSIFGQMHPHHLAAAGNALLRVTARGAERPSDDAVAALLLPVKVEERAKLLDAMAGRGPWSWREQTEFLARVPAEERANTADILHSFHGGSEELITTPQARTALLTQLRPATAHRILQDVSLALLRTHPVVLDLTALVQALNLFESSGERRQAIRYLRPDMPPEEMLEHLRSHGTARAADAPQPHLAPVIAQAWQADENVMLAEHRAAVGRSIQALVARYPEPMDATLNAFHQRPMPRLAAATVRLLLNPHQEALPISDTCRVSALTVLGLVLHAIDHWRDPTGDAATQRGREMMHEALLRNLERCWKPSEYGGEPEPVCVFGQMERMLVPLSGYDADVQLVLMTPGELVNEVAAPIQAARGDTPVSEATLQQFLQACHTLAHELFAGDAEQVAACDSLARAALPLLRE